MARAAPKKVTKASPKAKIRRSKTMQETIEDGKEFIKSRRPKPISKPLALPTRTPAKKKAAPKRRPKAVPKPIKKAVPKKAVPKKAPLKVRPAKKAKPARPALGLFGSSIAASGSIFGLFGSSGTLTTATTFEKGKKPEEIVPVDVTKVGKYKTDCSVDLTPGARLGDFEVVKATTKGDKEICDNTPPSGSGSCKECKGGVTYIQFRYLGPDAKVKFELKAGTYKIKVMNKRKEKKRSNSEFRIKNVKVNFFGFNFFCAHLGNG